LPTLDVARGRPKYSIKIVDALGMPLIGTVVASLFLEESCIANALLLFSCTNCMQMYAFPRRLGISFENLCRYVACPAVTIERLSRFPAGRVLYRLRHRWRDGTTHVIFHPVDLIGKLAALVPPPRFNLVRYHGVLAPSASSSIQSPQCFGTPSPSTVRSPATR
jgi:hypothetical protein